MKEKLVKAIAAISATMMLFGMTAFAAPKTMSDGGTFDPEYYAQQNPDVVAALGTDENVLYQHYLNNGKAEGRLPYANGVSLVDTKQEQINAVITQIEQYRTVMYDAVGRHDLETTEEAKAQDNAQAQACAQQIIALNNQYKSLTGEEYVYTQNLIIGGKAIIPCVIHTSAGDVVPTNFRAKYPYKKWNTFMFQVVVPDQGVVEDTKS